MVGWFNRENTFMVISLSIAALFGWGFFTEAGLPPTNVGESWQLLLIFMIFLIIPFAKKLDFFQFFSFEAKIAEVRREVGETKEKVSDVREDVRHVIAQQNALSASVQSMNHQAVTVNNYDRPPQEQLDAAQAEVANVEPANSDPLLQGLTSDEKLMQLIFNTQDQNDTSNDYGYSKLQNLFLEFDDINELRKLKISERVAILRIRVERELKRLIKANDNGSWQDTRAIRRLMPTRELVKNVMGFHPELEGQSDSFDVFFRIANAAVHADEVPNKDLNTAIYLGERLLGLLTKIQPFSSDENGARCSRKPE